MICQTCRTALRTQRLTPLRFSSTLKLPPPPRSSPRALPHQTSIRPFSSSITNNSSSSTPSSTTAQQQQQQQQQPNDDPASMSPAESHIAQILSSHLQPTRLLVQDISGGCGSMYAIDISSPLFRGLSMLKQQRMVNAALGDLVKEWHGVQIRTEVSP